MIKTHRIPFLLIAFLSLLVGVFAGLARLGWAQFSFPAMIHHGGIMVGGFLGTLISLEKVIPLKKKWLYIFPLLSGSSIVAFFVGSTGISFTLLLAASVGLSGAFLVYWMRERSLIYAMMFFGALSWLAGNALMLRENFYPLAIAWWMGFALLIISAERLELMKFLPVSNRAKYVFVSLLTLFLAGAAMSFHGPGSLLAGFSLVCCAAWLLKFDLVAITIKKSGLQKFVAVSLLSGYISLLLTGIFMISLADGAFTYDIIIHTFFVGFVFAMIFAHGPIILPGVIGSSAKPFHAILYVWLTLLHASWMFRMAGGVALQMEWRMASGIISLVGILGYLISLGFLTFRSIRAMSLPKKNIKVTA